MISLTLKTAVLAESGNFFMALGANQAGNGEPTAPLKVGFTGENRKLRIYFSEDILADGKMDMVEVLDSIGYDYYNVTDEIEKSQWNSFRVTDMAKMKMMIETRPRYPSDKLTFTIADVTKHKDTRVLYINLNLNEQFDVDVVLEDSQRNSVS